MEGLIILAMPFIVTSIAGVIKTMPIVSEAGGWRIPAIRAAVAIFSLLGAIGTQMLGGEVVDNAIIETTLLTTFNGVAATVIYFIYRKKKAN